MTNSPGGVRGIYVAYLPTSASDADIDGLEAEVAAWTPVTHVFWALWAVIQAKYSVIDFDFLGFAAMRMKVFRGVSRGRSGVGSNERRPGTHIRSTARGMERHRGGDAVMATINLSERRPRGANNLVVVQPFL